MHQLSSKAILQCIRNALMFIKNSNKSVKNPDSFQVNTALQRCLAKCCAMHGLGHYIYAGEDLPQGVEEPESPVEPRPDQ